MTDTVKKVFNWKGTKIPDDTADWFGNETLHNLIISQDTNITMIKDALIRNPLAAKSCNQFGRTPLHYAFDRTKVNVDVVRILLKACPEAMYVEDNNYETPYDIAIKWNHSNKILYLLLQQDPRLNYRKFLVIKYGCFLGSMLYLLCRPFKGRTKRIKSATKIGTIAPTASPPITPTKHHINTIDAEVKVSNKNPSFSNVKDISQNSQNFQHEQFSPTEEEEEEQEYDSQNESDDQPESRYKEDENKYEELARRHYNDNHNETSHSHSHSNNQDPDDVVLPIYEEHSRSNTSFNTTSTNTMNTNHDHTSSAVNQNSSFHYRNHKDKHIVHFAESQTATTSSSNTNDNSSRALIMEEY